MKRILFLAILFFNFTLVFADEPPSWQPYKKVSDNSEFFAWINYADNDTIKDPWERKWQLSVFNKDSTLLSKREYKPTGYNDGYLTDNGKNIVIIEFWYYPKGNAVSIFNENSNDFFIKGEEFKIPDMFLKETVSHKLWTENYEVKNNQIFIETLDKTKWKIDIDKKTLEKENTINFYLLIISWLIVILIVSFILIKRKNNCTQ